MDKKEGDFLIIGSGIAGISYALKVADYGKVLMLTKSDEDESNTKYAQGGIAAVMYAPDSYEKHVEDTLICGDGECNEKVVKLVIGESTERINELIQGGAQFDKTSSGSYDLAKEGGHSEKRILHHKDNTGFEIERALLAQAHQHPNIEILSHYYAMEVITQHHLGVWVNSQTPGVECYGVYALNLKTEKIEIIAAKIVLMASGGCGHIYESTTNPTIATGDGVAMVYRAKGRIEDMEFIQFHPTALYEPGLRGQAFLITEAVRGEGAILRNQQGDDFMRHYDPRKDLAPRDIVARAIDSEMKKSGTEYVWLDCTQIDPVQFNAHFPTIQEKCMSIGIDVSKQFIPVAPAAHYSCGGIQTNEWGCSSIQQLYACGECASTGVHGANRLASNSLLEAMVFAHRCFEDARARIHTYEYNQAIPDWSAKGTTDPKEMILITQSLKELQQIMSDYVGIVRNDIRLQRASRRLDLLWEETEQLYQNTTVSPQLLELRNMISIGYLIVKCATFRKESRGLHYNTDYPQPANLVQNIVL